MKKRILACLLALVMLIGVMPVMALAEDSSTAVIVSDGMAKVGREGGDCTLATKISRSVNLDKAFFNAS